MYKIYADNFEEKYLPHCYGGIVHRTPGIFYKFLAHFHTLQGICGKKRGFRREGEAAARIPHIAEF
ncbi:MAG: hypothetical protein LBE02_07040, partial [Spirochaetaceae bacterium]|nr:hypothetical protein [Spirochaetaceae bacterium]